uniref:Uncharacterized protein n=1 Tax=Anguilla anguilla TaxID=7936 RepID=A0A0E9PVL8_ANGAN
MLIFLIGCFFMFRGIILPSYTTLCQRCLLMP